MTKLAQKAAKAVRDLQNRRVKKARQIIDANRKRLIKQGVSWDSVKLVREIRDGK